MGLLLGKVLSGFSATFVGLQADGASVIDPAIFGHTDNIDIDGGFGALLAIGISMHILFFQLGPGP